MVGMRGVVSLAAALAIPITLNDGIQFPQRNLILFITFIVILVTLVLQDSRYDPHPTIGRVRCCGARRIGATMRQIVRQGLKENAQQFSEEQTGNDLDGQVSLQHLVSFGREGRCHWNGWMNDKTPGQFFWSCLNGQRTIS